MAIARLNLAFDRSMQDENGQYQTVANYIDVTAFGKTAENAAEQLHKGSALIIEGQFQYRSYTDKESQQRRIYEILANKIYPLEKDENAQKQAPQTRTQSKEHATRQTEETFPEPPVGDGMDDIPF